jgi:hypothetical protein
MKKTTKKQRIIDFFVKNPDAAPATVAAKFDAALPTIYTLRKEAREIAEPVREPEVSTVTEDVSVSASDWQVGGDHYKNMGVEPWDVVDTWPREQRIGYYRGGALKYIMRMGSKDVSAQEIAKGEHYIQKLLEVLEEVGE